MTLSFSPSSVIPYFPITQLKLYDLKFKSSSASDHNLAVVRCNIPRGPPCFSQNVHPSFKNKPWNTSRYIVGECMNSNSFLSGEDSTAPYDWKEQQEGEFEEVGSPWEGAVLYQRNPSILHIEYCTTLERLGLGQISTEVSRSRASTMGIRVTKAVKDFPLGTPVLISVDVIRKKKRLRLDGIVRTVISLYCNSCGKPTAKCVFSNFSLLLTEEPFEEPELIDMGVIFGEDEVRTSGTSRKEEEDDEGSIDLDDRLYFPPEEKTVDISKHIRDMVHVEITLDVLCDPSCKGLCLKCGSNLNTTTCKCSEQKVEKKVYRPLRGLRKQMQKIDVFVHRGTNL